MPGVTSMPYRLPLVCPEHYARILWRVIGHNQCQENNLTRPTPLQGTKRASSGRPAVPVLLAATRPYFAWAAIYLQLPTNFLPVRRVETMSQRSRLR